MGKCSLISTILKTIAEMIYNISWHADFFNGWKDGAIPGLLDSCDQGVYGNQDIANCSTFEKSSVPKSKCNLKTSFNERVDSPGKALPGCNPVRDTNPAPIYEIAPLGTYSTDCTLAGGSPGGDEPAGSASSVASVAPSSKDPMESSKAMESSTAIESSTFAVTAKSSDSVSTSSVPYSDNHSTSPAISCPSSNRDLHKSHGKTFKIQCNIDHAGGDLKLVYVDSLEKCIAACAKNDAGVDVSLSATACYLKSEVGKKVHRPGLAGAKLVDSGMEGTVTTMQADAKPTHHRHAHHKHGHAVHDRRRSF